MYKENAPFKYDFVGSFLRPDTLKKADVYKRQVIACGIEIFLYTTVTYFLCGIMELFPGAMRGMGYSFVPMIISIIGTVGLRIVWIFWVFPNNRSLDVLFISYPASWILTIAMQVTCFLFVRKRVFRKMKETNVTSI